MRGMKVWKSIGFGCLALAVGMFSLNLSGKEALGAGAKQFNLRLQRYVGTMMDEEFARYAKTIAEMSDGRIKIVNFRGGELVPNDQMMEAVGKGTLDMCDGYGGYWAGKIDLANIEAGLPSAWTTLDEAMQFYYGKGFLELAREAYAEHNVYYLAPIFGGPYELLAKKPVKSLSDLKGMKIRASSTMAAILKKFDIATTYIPAEELYVAMATGTIDGLIYGGAYDYSEMKLQEVAKDYTQLNLLYPGYVDCVLINMKVWNSLPKDLQQILEIGTRGGLAHDYHMWTLRNTAKVLEEGLFNVYTLPPEDVAALSAAAQEVLKEEASKSARNAKAVNWLKEIARVSGRIK